MNSMLCSPQRVTSELLMGREALETTVSLLQNFLKPPPVPETPTVILARLTF